MKDGPGVDVAATADDGGERGDVAPTVILTSLTVFLVMFVVQMGMYFHARTVVNAAVEDGLRAAQVQGGTVTDAESAIDTLMGGSSSLLVNPTRSVTVGAEVISIEVSAEVPSLVPFWSGGVSARSTGPIERFRSEAQRS